MTDAEAKGASGADKEKKSPSAPRKEEDTKEPRNKGDSDADSGPFKAQPWMKLD
jgi:hypothetical protein